MSRSKTVSDGWMSSEVNVECEMCGALVDGPELCDECRAYVGIWAGAEIISEPTQDTPGQSRPARRGAGK